MLLVHCHWFRWLQLVILISALIPSILSSSNASHTDVLANRDGEKPILEFEVDRRRKSVNIANAHEVLRQGLRQFLDLIEDNSDLGYYINYLLHPQRNTTFVDEYGEEIRSYKKVFRFIWKQFNETLIQNYAVSQFDKDKLDLCSVARYLSHQPAVENRKTIMKRMGDALEYRCHPCTPYKRKEHSEPPVINTDDINPDGISPEESLIMCKGFEFSDETGNKLPSTTSTTMATGRPFSHGIPPPRRANLINGHGKCFSDGEHHPDYSGHHLYQWDCDPSTGAMLWSWNQVSLGSEDGHVCNGRGKCVASANNLDRSTHLIVWEHSDEHGQRFYFSDSLDHPGFYVIQNGHGKCLSVKDDTNRNGAEIWANNCNPSEMGQRWKWLN